MTIIRTPHPVLAEPGGIGKYLCLGTLLLLLVSGCATGPVDYPRQYSEALPADQTTRLGREIAEWQEAHPEHEGKSGFYPLASGNDALGARLALIDMAERSIDAQYFLMKPDAAGFVFSKHLLQAADRGVRVRFLLDDVFTTVSDKELSLLDEHPNIELRLFNPTGRGGVGFLNFLGDFKRANRRMHNKTFTVDNHVSIVGGRNIAAEYFELKEKVEFRDFDMLAVGPIASDISETFDRFWNHEWSVPMDAFRSKRDTKDLDTVRAELDPEVLDRYYEIYSRAIDSTLVQDLINDRRTLTVAHGEVVTDDPAKLQIKAGKDPDALITRLAQLTAEAELEVVWVTPYFIPLKSGVEFWRKLVEKGVRVVIVTNSLASNNHTPVHAAYARYRRDIIRSGVELYELRVDEVRSGRVEELNLESVTLHTKVFAVDRRYLSVGSLNLDPRSIDINTEFMLLVDSPQMTQAIVPLMLESLLVRAYRVTENEKGQLRWTTVEDGRQVVETHEPKAGLWLRFKAFVSKIAPESQL